MEKLLQEKRVHHEESLLWLPIPYLFHHLSLARPRPHPRGKRYGKVSDSIEAHKVLNFFLPFSDFYFCHFS